MPFIELLFIILFTKLGKTLSSIHGNNYYTPEFSNCTCNHTNNINFQFDLNQLFSSLKSSAESSNGFAKSSVNAGTRNQINGLIMCYNDAAQGNCSACLNFSTESAIKLCPDSRSVTFTYDWCFLRYSDDNFISSLTLDQMPNCINNEFDVSNSSSMHGTVFELLNSLRLEAINSTQLYAYGNMTDPGINHSVYGLVECTKDLSQYDCGSCIKSAIENLSGCSRNTRARGARISFMSCYIRYELYPLPLLTFKQLVPAPGPLPPKLLPPFNEGSKTKHVGVAAICAPGSFLFFVVAVVCFGRMLKTKNIKTTCDKVASINGSKEVEETSLESTGVHGDCQVFLLSEIKSATDNFSDENKLGEGGFGPVYRGVLPNGEGIAVKRLAGWSKQGFVELKNEVVLLAKLNHKNLVKLLGYCVEEKEKLLCYEYLCNESLDKHLFGTYINSNLGEVMDLKPSNILLDENMNPKISDFGLARLYNDDQTHKETSIIAGTCGYMAPEYAMHGMYSAKLDVYSFGVLLLEIITGRKNSSFCNNQLAANLISYVRNLQVKLVSILCLIDQINS
ncbi:hypothetical protein LUZ61_016528 [Rhynchospora tenuis]|uniref:Uncharacterized protein n=1 Tax=Rhynchospora tenuis TaxID=198213 RepID=A0AAD6EK67_9POAL|nr:hypothetical protein LUZ61_016528 [Rhynchospora tenuis]